MKYTLLHISDLRFRIDWHEEAELVCDKFLKDISEQISNYENVYVVFSGDIVQKGDDKDQYNSFLKKFCHRLDTMGLHRHYRVCVPGNHDASRNALRPLLTMHEGALSVIKDERSFNDNLQQLSKLFFNDKFEIYKIAEAEFAKYTSCSKDLGGTGWEIGNEVGLYCLNTALCSYGGLDDASGKTISDKGRLQIDTRSLYRWIGENQSSFRILVMHHPLDWLSDWAKSELENAIADNFHLVLWGHNHEAGATFCSRGYGGSVPGSTAVFEKK